jgi:predicted MPP superfamily phosphohydrolase
MQENRFSWLHLSDLHMGMPGQGWMWPTLKHTFFDDLRQIHRKVGDWDVVVFSGDLTQTGAKTEFDALSSSLIEIWKVFEELGFAPKLFVVPGNHDLARPDPLDPAVKVLKNWTIDEEVRQEIWKNESSPYKRAIDGAFENFIEWRDLKLPSSVPLLAVQKGYLPGDCSSSLEIRGTRIGLVGLNSAWLQLGSEDFEERLHVDTWQLLRVTGGDPVAWCRENTFNLLITHHPAAWLSAESKAYWNSEINPAGRFSAHLYGHMHIPDTASVSQAGAPRRTAIQAASLFGLEKFGANQVQRIHGYSIGQVSFDSAETILTIWPRRSRHISGGAIRMGPDQSFDLNEENCIVERRLNVLDVATPRSSGVEISEVIFEKAAAASNVLAKVRYALGQHPAHLDVRRVEQQACLAALKERRTVWIVADWGMGADAFIWALQRRVGESDQAVYRLDAHTYTSRAKFMDAIRRQLGCGLEQLCDLLAAGNGGYLILDDLPIGDQSDQEEALLKSDIDDVVQTITQYCPAAKVIVRSRRTPKGGGPSIELKPFDEADTKAYVGEHKERDSALSTDVAHAQFFRFTDGVPSRIDSALRDLAVTSLQELTAAHSERLRHVEVEDIPEALVKAVGELSTSSNPILNRAFDLLKALAIFPQGEQLSHIRRFKGVHPFFPPHARELIDRALVDSISAPQVGVVGAGDVTKVLVERRVVRDYVKTLLSEAEFVDLNRQAVSLYFGDHWINGVYKSPAQLRFDDPHRGSPEILNAAAVLTRLLRKV